MSKAHKRFTIDRRGLIMPHSQRKRSQTHGREGKEGENYLNKTTWLASKSIE